MPAARRISTWKKTLFSGDAAAEERRLLEDASDAMAAKGGGRGKGGSGRGGDGRHARG